MPDAMPSFGQDEDESRRPYRVNWSMNFAAGPADSPLAAARAALEVQRDPSSMATVFTVADPDGRRWHVDLHAPQGGQVSEIPGPMQADTDRTAPEAHRFSLDKAQAENWLRLASPGAGDDSETAPANAKLPDGIEPPEAEIGAGWDPRESGQEANIDLLVQGAVNSGIIQSPEGWELYFESEDTLGDGSYYFLVREVNGPLKIVSETGDMSRIGVAGATGIPAALAILGEAEHSANAALDSLDSHIAARLRPAEVDDRRLRRHQEPVVLVSDADAALGSGGRPRPASGMPFPGGPVRGAAAGLRASSVSRRGPKETGGPGLGAR